MSRILLSAGKYVQGSDVVKTIGSHACGLGTKALLIGGSTALSLASTTIQQSLSQQNISYAEATFKGISSKNEINRLVKIAQSFNADIIIAIGGGAAIDAGKAVSHEIRTPIIVVPTTAATDAPCSALCVIYADDGTFDSYLRLLRNPDCVLMDTNIIAKAPVRFLIAGMGDAVACFWESKTCEHSEHFNAFNGGTSPTLTIKAISKLCYTTLLESGTQAISSVKQKIVTQALESIVEANTLMSGLCAENGGHAAAHSINNGFSVLEETRRKLHGEKVAFGLLAQIVLENHPQKQFQEVQNFCHRVGLPICLEDLGLTNPTTEEIKLVATRSVASGETIHTSRVKVIADIVEDAIWAVDKLGKIHKQDNQ